MTGGFIKLFRSLKEWEWYDDHNATRLLIHLLISVNFEDKKWRGILVEKGTMVFSWNTLSDEIGLTVKQCRVAMKKLERAGEVARKRTNKYQLVTLVKWDKMQIEQVSGAVNEARNKADGGQAKGRQRATTKEREEREEGKEIKKERGRFTPPTLDEVDVYFLAHLDFEKSKSEAEKFVNYYASKGWMVGKTKMKNWKGAAANWLKRLQEFEKEKSSGKKEKSEAYEFAKNRYSA